MILGIAAFTAYTVWSRPAEPGVRRYEAGPDGRITEVAAPVGGTAPAQLWKPEPAELLRNTKLKLSESQRSRIGAIAESWSVTKADLLRQMRSELDSAKVDARRSIGAIRASLNGYSDLSRRFELDRIAAWDKAVRLLDSRQKSLIEKGARL